MAIATAMLTDMCHEPADEPPSTPTVESSLAEVKQWLQWFLSENTELSPKRQAALASKLACSGKTLLSYTKEDLLRISPDFGAMIFNALPKGLNHFPTTHFTCAMIAPHTAA
jgi:hypothetical protein